MKSYLGEREEEEERVPYTLVYSGTWSTTTTHTHTHTHTHTYTCTAVYLSFVHPYLPGVVEGTCGRTAALTEPNVTPGHTFQHVPIEAAVVGCVCV